LPARKFGLRKSGLANWEKIVADLFPESKGNIQKVDLGKLLEAGRIRLAV